MNGERRKNAYFTFVTESEERIIDGLLFGKGEKRKVVYFTFLTDVDAKDGQHENR